MVLRLAGTLALPRTFGARFACYEGLSVEIRGSSFFWYTRRFPSDFERSLECLLRP